MFSNIRRNSDKIRFSERAWGRSCFSCNYLQCVGVGMNETRGYIMVVAFFVNIVKDCGLYIICI